MEQVWVGLREYSTAQKQEIKRNWDRCWGIYTLKMENLDVATKKSPKDLGYIKRLKNIAEWLQYYLNILGGGLWPTIVTCLPAKGAWSW